MRGFSPEKERSDTGWPRYPVAEFGLSGCAAEIGVRRPESKDRGKRGHEPARDLDRIPQRGFAARTQVFSFPEGPDRARSVRNRVRSVRRWRANLLFSRRERLLPVGVVRNWKNSVRVLSCAPLHSVLLVRDCRNFVRQWVRKRLFSSRKPQHRPRAVLQPVEIVRVRIMFVRTGSRNPTRSLTAAIQRSRFAQKSSSSAQHASCAVVHRARSVRPAVEFAHQRVAEGLFGAREAISPLFVIERRARGAVTRPAASQGDRL